MQPWNCHRAVTDSLPPALYRFRVATPVVGQGVALRPARRPRPSSSAAGPVVRDCHSGRADCHRRVTVNGARTVYAARTSDTPSTRP